VQRSILVSAFLLLVISSIQGQSQGLGVTVSSTDASINNAFSSVYQAERNGGNVSSLVQELNAAILLVEKAEAENSTQANIDLNNATQIAQKVSQESASVSAAGSASRQAQWYESIGIIVASVIGSTLAYTHWDPIYRRLWLLIYRKYVVTRKHE
jgi:hypothetical protein